MALVRAICFSMSSGFMPCIISLAPGIFSMIWLIGPIFFNCSKSPRKSSMVKVPVKIFSACACACSWSSSSCAFSTRETMSPMPRIRDAIRSGWNSSKSSTFSPTPTNLIGLPVIAFTDIAAPPRASPSSFVRMTPVRASSSSKAFAELTAS